MIEPDGAEAYDAIVGNSQDRVEALEAEVERLKAVIVDRQLNEIDALQQENAKMVKVIKKMGAAIWDAYEPGCDCPTCALAEILNELPEEEE